MTACALLGAWLFVGGGLWWFDIIYCVYITTTTTTTTQRPTGHSPPPPPHTHTQTTTTTPQTSDRPRLRDPAARPPCHRGHPPHRIHGAGRHALRRHGGKGIGRSVDFRFSIRNPTEGHRMNFLTQSSISPGSWLFHRVVFYSEGVWGCGGGASVGGWGGGVVFMQKGIVV